MQAGTDRNLSINYGVGSIRLFHTPGLIEKLHFRDVQLLTGCCPNENLFERSLKRFLFINLGELKEKRFQLFEPEGRVLESPGASLRFIKKRFRASEK